MDSNWDRYIIVHWSISPDALGTIMLHRAEAERTDASVNRAGALSMKAWALYSIIDQVLKQSIESGQPSFITIGLRQQNPLVLQSSLQQ